MSPGAVGKLLDISKKLGYREMWVYWQLTAENNKAVNIPLLSEIARQLGYKPGWVYFARKKIIERRRVDNEWKKSKTN